jgi:hypothetical protein
MIKNVDAPARRKAVRQPLVRMTYDNEGAITTDPNPCPERAIAMATPLLRENHFIMVEVNGTHMVLEPIPPRTP